MTQRLLRASKEADILARVGGDEFCVLVLNIRSIEEAQLVVRRIMSTLMEHFESASVTLSALKNPGVRVTLENLKQVSLITE